MRKDRYITLLLALVAVLLSVSTSRAQGTATVTVTLIVLPPPQMSFTTNTTRSSGVSAVKDGRTSFNQGMTLESHGNVMVQLSSAKSRNTRFNFSQGEIKTFTPRELKGVSKIEVEYLDS